MTLRQIFVRQVTKQLIQFEAKCNHGNAACTDAAITRKIQNMYATTT